MTNYFEISCWLLATLLALYYYFTSTYDFWKIRGVPGPRPIPFFGNVKNVILGRMSMCDYFKEVYDEYTNEPMVGIFARKTPILILKDLELIKDILISDFSKFADRGMKLHERAEPLAQNILNFEPERWRPLRTRLSPVFTTGKLKEMFPLILECSEHFEKYLEKVVQVGKPVECRGLTSKFTIDVIGSCAFGMEMHALSDENSEFYRMGIKIFSVDFAQILRMRIRETLPWLYDLLSYVLPRTEVTRFFTKIVADTMDYRKKNNIVRQDFINTLLDLQRNPDKLGNIKLTDGLLTAQAFLFFAAGFETSSTTMSNALYELALQPRIQDKLRREINQVYAKSKGDLKFDDVREMKYLDAIFRETLRKYPPAPLLMRQSTSSYTFKGTKVVIPKNVKVWIPAYAIQRDPNIYPNPEDFDPERFKEDVDVTKHTMKYLAFGDGPRNCVGARFATCETKIGLIKILRNYKVDVCEKTQIPYVNHPTTFLLAPKDGIYLKISKV